MNQNYVCVFVVQLPGDLVSFRTMLNGDLDWALRVTMAATLGTIVSRKRAKRMTKTTLYTLLFAGVGLLFIALSIPLIQERVPPNSTYGFRTTLPALLKLPFLHET